jgi:integrase/recombinase XerD
MKPLSLEEAYRSYRNDKLADGYSKNTLDIYDWTMGEMIKVLNNPIITQITLTDLRKFMLHMRVDYKTRQGENLSGSSVENAWKGVRSFFGWAHEVLDVVRPDNDLPRPKYTSKEIEPFTLEEVKLLIDACRSQEVPGTDKVKGYKRKRATGLRDKALILLLTDTGLRISEALRLNIEDVSLENYIIKVKPYGSGQKTKARHVPLGKSSRSALWRYLIERDPAPHEPVFTTHNSIKAMDRGMAFHTIRRLGDRAGVPNAHPHRFRHTFGRS